MPGALAQQLPAVEESDFASACSARIDLFDALPRGIASFTLGQDRYGRALIANSTAIAGGRLLYALEGAHNDGPWDNQQALVFAMLLGSGVGATVWLLNLAALVRAMQRPWLRILVRVFGSWVAACSILVLALLVAGRPSRSSGGPSAPAPSASAVSPVLDVRRF